MRRPWEIIDDDMSPSESSMEESDTYDADALTAKLHSFDDCHFGGHDSNESKLDFLNIPGSRSESTNFDDSLYLDVCKESNNRGIEAFHHSGALDSLFLSPTSGDENKPKEPTKRQRSKGTKEACDFVKSSSPTEKEQVVAPIRGSKKTVSQSKGTEEFMSTLFKEVKVGSKPQQRNSRSTLSKVRPERTSPPEVSSNSPPPGPPQRSYVVPLTTSETTNSSQGSSQKGNSKDLDSSTHCYTRKRSSRRRSVKDSESSSHSRTRQRSSSRNTRGTEHRGSVDVNRSRSPIAPSRDLESSSHSRTRQRSSSRNTRGTEHRGSVDVNRSRSPIAPSRDLDSSSHSHTRQRSSSRNTRGTEHRGSVDVNRSRSSIAPTRDLDSSSHSQTRRRSSSRNTRGTEHRGSVDVSRPRSPITPSRRSASRDLNGSAHSPGGNRRRLQPKKNTSERRGSETGRSQKLQHSPKAGRRKASDSIIKSPDHNDDGAPASSRSLGSKPSDSIIKSPDQNDDGAPASSRCWSSESGKHRTTTRNSRGGGEMKRIASKSEE
jgi:hypothetical protein